VRNLRLVIVAVCLNHKVSEKRKTFQYPRLPYSLLFALQSKLSTLLNKNLRINITFFIVSLSTIERLICSSNGDPELDIKDLFKNL